METAFPIAQPLQLGCKARISLIVGGVMSEADAVAAATAGAQAVAILLGGKGVSLQQAVDIAAAAWEAGAETVGVFDAETAPTIIEWASLIGLSAVVLLGGVKEALPILDADLPPDIVCILGQRVDLQGQPVDKGIVGMVRQGDWILVDGMVPAMDQWANWNKLIAPRGPWILGGGLTPTRVAEAIQRWSPQGIYFNLRMGGEKRKLSTLAQVEALVNMIADLSLSEST